MTLKERAFVRTVWQHYRRQGRHSLPWRRTRQPYRVLVSEVMLQQTQVERVVPKYKSFLKRFPTVHTLANAPLGAVLREWQGLGYNRRAKMLHICAQRVVKERKGRFPKTYTELIALPGVGPYTAGAILAFAFNKGIPIVETNVRSVFLRHFFAGTNKVDDRDILPLVERTLDLQRPRDWYFALMDYGSYLKKTHGNENVRSRHYARQSPYKNSDRHVRGAILRLLSEKNRTVRSIHETLTFDLGRIAAQLERLRSEGLVAKSGRTYVLPE